VVGDGAHAGHPLVRVAFALRTAPRAARAHRFPRLRWFALAWLLAYVPAWYATYGAWHFLFLCNLGVILTAVGLWFDQPLLLSSQAVAAPSIAALWLADAGWLLATGEHLHGGTAYMRDPAIPAIVRAMSLYHLAWPLLLAWCLRRTGHDRRGFPLQVAIVLGVFAIGLWVAPASENLNYVVAAPDATTPYPQPFARALLHLAILVVACYAPTEIALRRYFRAPSRGP
jgi:hypothetical protein